MKAIRLTTRRKRPGLCCGIARVRQPRARLSQQPGVHHPFAPARVRLTGACRRRCSMKSRKGGVNPPARAARDLITLTAFPPTATPCLASTAAHRAASLEGNVNYKPTTFARCFFQTADAMWCRTRALQDHQGGERAKANPEKYRRRLGPSRRPHCHRALNNFRLKITSFFHGDGRPDFLGRGATSAARILLPFAIQQKARCAARDRTRSAIRVFRGADLRELGHTGSRRVRGIAVPKPPRAGPERSPT